MMTNKIINKEYNDNNMMPPRFSDWYSLQENLYTFRDPHLQSSSRSTTSVQLIQLFGGSPVISSVLPMHWETQQVSNPTVRPNLSLESNIFSHDISSFIFNRQPRQLLGDRHDLLFAQLVHSHLWEKTDSGTYFRGLLRTDPVECLEKPFWHKVLGSNIFPEDIDCHVCWYFLL